MEFIWEGLKVKEATDSANEPQVLQIFQERRIEAMNTNLLGKTPVTLGNTNLYGHYENPRPFTNFGEKCRKYNTGFLYARETDSVDISKFPTDYSASVEECLAKPGVHCWLVLQDGAFVAARVFSEYEILSKHMDLYLRSGKIPVIAAGEVEITEDKGVLYNFLSGTFMLDIAERFAAKYTHTQYTSFYGPWMDRLWEQAGATSVTQVDATLIDRVPLTEEVLREYSKGGIEFKVFPTQGLCRKYSSYHSPLGKAQRKSLLEQYERGAQKTMTFNEWLKKTGYEPIFQEPAVNSRTVFQGGNRRGTRRKHRARKTRKS